jgi:hypothetical protein
VAVGRDEHVFGFEVAVDDALCVGGREPVGHMGNELDGVPPRDRAPSEPGTQRFSLEQLDHRHGLTVDDGELVDGHDVGMGDCGYRTRLVLETRAHLHVGREMIRQHLERDLAAQPRVARTIHLAHPAGADWRHHLELRETRTWNQTHRGFLRGRTLTL